MAARPLESARPGEVARQIREPGSEALEHLVVDRLSTILDRRARALAQIADRPAVDRHAHDRTLEQAAALQPIQRSKGHHLGEVSGDPEDVGGLRFVGRCGARVRSDCRGHASALWEAVLVGWMLSDAAAARHHPMRMNSAPVADPAMTRAPAPRAPGGRCSPTASACRAQHPRGDRSEPARADDDRAGVALVGDRGERSAGSTSSGIGSAGPQRPGLPRQARRPRPRASPGRIAPRPSSRGHAAGTASPRRRGDGHRGHARLPHRHDEQRPLTGEATPSRTAACGSAEPSWAINAGASEVPSPPQRLRP
jgi:hypothetical protein